ncbi:DUF421 domain-containing protein [Paenirhodobacter sp.]|uniref:DUF421 domain-containing protein n=1 Tax=Paenirhodobacter sp. TaxID=1965326 RepID=UPI003B426484
MADLWLMSAPWWHFALRGVVIYVLVTTLMRVSGKRAMGQFTPFDMILLILIGNAVQNGMNGGDNSLTGATIMAGTLIVMNLVVAWGSARSRRFRWVVEGRPTLLAENGRIDHRTLRRQLVSEEDFLNAMRSNGCNEVRRIRRATLEPNGQIMIETID